MRESREDVTKLPKWAQQKIQLLERDRNYWHGLANRVDAGDSDLAVDTGSHSSVDFVHLAARTVYVMDRETGRPMIDLTAKIENGGRVIALSAYDGTLRIIPWAANHVRVEVIR